nr:MAG TPA: hypothetical protein [Caudoviricetes sp.]
MAIICVVELYDFSLECFVYSCVFSLKFSLVV